MKASTQKIGRAQSSREKAYFAFFVDNPRSQPALNAHTVACRERALRTQAIQQAREGLLDNPDRIRHVEALLDDADPEVRELAGHVLDVAERDQRHFCL